MYDLMWSFSKICISFIKKFGLRNNLSVDWIEICIFYFFSWCSSTCYFICFFQLILISIWNLIVAFILIFKLIYYKFIYWCSPIYNVWLLIRIISTYYFHYSTCIIVFYLFNTCELIFSIFWICLLIVWHIWIFIIKNINIVLVSFHLWVEG